MPQTKEKNLVKYTKVRQESRYIIIIADRKMRTGKVFGSDQINIEIWKFRGDRECHTAFTPRRVRRSTNVTRHQHSVGVVCAQ